MAQARLAWKSKNVILRLSAVVHQVFDEGHSPSGCVMDTVTLCCSSWRLKVSDEGSMRSHARIRDGVLDGCSAMISDRLTRLSGCSPILLRSNGPEHDQGLCA